MLFFLRFCATTRLKRVTSGEYENVRFLFMSDELGVLLFVDKITLNFVAVYTFGKPI